MSKSIKEAKRARAERRSARMDAFEQISLEHSFVIHDNKIDFKVLNRFAERANLGVLEKEVYKEKARQFVEMNLRNETMTVRSLISRVASNKVDKFFINMGSSADEMAESLGVSVDDLRDGANWSGDVYSDPSGAAWQFTFRYNGVPYARVI